MTRRIYKYPFPVADLVEVDMPAGAKIVHVDVQRGTACIWALVDPTHPPEVHRFRVVGTGHSVGDDEEHVATFLMPPFAWHLLREMKA